MKTILYIVFTKDHTHFYTFTYKKNAINKCLEMGIDTNSILTYDEDKVAKALQDDVIYERIDKAEFDRFDLDKNIARNGYKRLIYNLNKIGLTIQEWDIWCTL
jgi:hypothetical protein